MQPEPPRHVAHALERRDRCAGVGLSPAARASRRACAFRPTRQAAASRRLRRRGLRRRGGLTHQQAQQRAEFLAHVAPIDDHVERAVIEQELAALETFGQRLAHRLLDDARPGETDQRARLRDVEIAEHRETRRHAAGGRIGHHGDERQPRLREPRQRGAGLRHLQQREQRLLHARAAARREAHERRAMLDAVVDRALEALADHRAHRAAQEPELERAGDDRQPFELARDRDQRILLAGRLLRLRRDDRGSACCRGT